jgi:hypothetical protein
MEGGLRPGTILLEKYRVESELGRGGMGVVLRVTHLHLGEELAIKIVLPGAGGGPEVHGRFLREAQSAVRLRGEHVARVGDVGVLPGGAPYMVMEYLRGGDLSGELSRRGALPPGEVVDYVLQACEALAEAHALGIVHRDIKPSNLFLTRRPDGSPLVKVLDFGISKAPIGGPGGLTKTDTVMGTPGYMSPEQMKASKDVDARSDIWALGIVLYECLHGRRPFDAETFSAIVLRAATEPTPPMDPRIPRGLQAVILHCLEKDRAARFPSVAALAAALAPFANDARSAGIIVERTAAMAKGPNAHVVQAPSSAQTWIATTLRASAGMVRARSRRRRYAIGGAMGLFGVLVVLVEVGAGGSRGLDGRAGPGSAPSVAAPPVPAEPHTGQASDRLAETRRDAGSAGPALVVMVDAAASPAAGDTDQAWKQKAATCAELDANQRWQELIDCASELASLGSQDKAVSDRAEELRARAARQAAAAVAAGKVQVALREGNLREAQRWMRAVPPDATSFPATLEAFRAAQRQAIEDNRRRAQAYAAAHDCTALKGLSAQVNATSTALVAGAVAPLVAKCLDAAPGATNAPSSGSKVTAPSQSTVCAAVNVDEIMTHAANQTTAGFPRTALELMNKALACTQNDQLYSLAAIYACAAKDVASAKKYYRKVSKSSQASVLQRCQQENIALP